MQRAAQAHGPGPSAKLELLEGLLESNDAADCARVAVAWLGVHGHSERILCAMVAGEPPVLTGLAGHGIDHASVLALQISLEEREQPLARVLRRGTAVVLPAGSEALAALPWLQRKPALAIPLGQSRESELRTGLLIVSPASGMGAQVARWVAELLGPKLSRLTELRSLSDAEARLERERRLLSNIINAVPDPVLLTDTDGRIVTSNTRAEALLAATEIESEGRRRAVALNNMLFSAALFQRAMGETGVARRELLLVDPIDGADLVFELLTAVSRDQREGTGLVSVLRNVTDLRRATEEIEENLRKLRMAEVSVRAERDRLDLIIDSVADPILVTDLAGNIVHMNSPAERLFTASPDGDEAQLRAVRANDTHFSTFVSNLLLTRTDRRWRRHVTLTDPETGSSIPMEAVSGKITSNQGEVTALVTILHDRSEAIEKAKLYEQVKAASEQLEEKVRTATAELVHQNELLQRQRVELEQASALKSQFIANVSHEFRTPLNAILGHTSMLLEGVLGELPASQLRALGKVDTNARHLLSIIDDILDIARIESGRLPLHLGAINIGELVTDVVTQVEPLIKRSRVSVLVKVPPRVPPLHSDRQKVKQIVLNLLTNALKFTPKGSITVKVTYEKRSDKVCIAVADTGIGIARADQEKVFEDFRQADSSLTREYGGAGLGLSICRRLAGMLDGSITLESRLGKGSTFTFTLPRLRRRRS